jgi:hypothetical protein
MENSLVAYELPKLLNWENINHLHRSIISNSNEIEALRASWPKRKKTKSPGHNEFTVKFS